MPAHLIAEKGPLQGTVFIFQDQDEWTMGRDPDLCTFVLEDHAVSRKHALFRKTDAGIELENLSATNPTQLNSEELIAPIVLKEGDQLQIGNTLFLFSEEEVPKKGKSKSKKKPKVTAYDSIFETVERTEETSEKKTSSTEIPSAYDTIFEDTKDETDIPFHLLSDTPFILKVIAGPNAGAEIGLEKGRRYILGKDTNSCDIVFQDLSVSRTHAALTIEEDGSFILEDLGSKNRTLVNGHPLEETQVITPSDLIALGTTIFVLIDKQAPQETIFSGTIPLPASEEPLEGEIHEEELSNWREEKVPRRHLIIAGSFIAMFLIVFVTLFSLFKSQPIEHVAKNPDTKIAAALADFPSVEFSYNPASAKIFLVGHILKGTDYQRMRFNLEELGFIEMYEDTVVVDELLAKSFNEVLSIDENFRQVTIQTPKAGRFVAVGYLQNMNEATRLSEYLATNFPYLEHLENKVVVEGTLMEQAKAILFANGFGNLGVQLSSGEIIITGNYSEENSSAYQAILKELNRLSGIRKVKNLAIATTSAAAMIDVSDQYRVTGLSEFDGHGYSVVLNGKIYTLGDFVGDLKITAIHSDTIWLEKDKIKYKINYAR